MESDLVLYAKWNLVGGSIFYVDNTSTDATYTFYDEKGNVLSTQTVEGLDGAFCYSVNGTPSKDKFYVAEKKEVVTKCTSGASGGVRKFDGTNYCVWAAGNDNELDSSKIEVLNGYGDSKIGAGKKNTAWIFANRNNSDYFPNGVVETGPGSGKYYYTCWDFCKYCRDNSVNGCDDWFVPSIAECKALRESKIWGDTNSDWVSTTCYVDERSYLWSSSAGSYAGYAWYWRVSSSASFANCYRCNYQSDDRFLAVVRAF